MNHRKIGSTQLREGKGRGKQEQCIKGRRVCHVLCCNRNGIWGLWEWLFNRD